MSIYATLHTAPTNHNHTHEMIYITRGASAELIYPLFDKALKPTDLDQVTFTFKQGKTLYWYSMFTYVVPSEDTSIKADKHYYNLAPISGLQCNLIEVENPTGNPTENGYFEISNNPTLNWKTTNYSVDPHFYLFENEDFGAILFNFDSEETKQFKANINVDYEVAIRLNTDNLSSLNNRDSIIIEPQHPIAVVDSLYSRVEGN